MFNHWCEDLFPVLLQRCSPIDWYWYSSEFCLSHLQKNTMFCLCFVLFCLHLLKIMCLHSEHCGIFQRWPAPSPAQSWECLYGLKESIRGLELYSQASATSQNLLFKNVVQINFGLVKFKYPQACQAILIQCNWRKKTTLQHHQLSLVIDIMHHYIAKVVSVSWTCMLCSWHDLSADYSCLGHL